MKISVPLFLSAIFTFAFRTFHFALVFLFNDHDFNDHDHVVDGLIMAPGAFDHSEESRYELWPGW